MYNTSKEDREELGKKGRQHVLNNYGFDSYVSQWDQELTRVFESKGSWSNRKHKSWEFLKVL